MAKKKKKSSTSTGRKKKGGSKKKKSSAKKTSKKKSSSKKTTKKSGKSSTKKGGTKKRSKKATSSRKKQKKKADVKVEEISSDRTGTEDGPLSDEELRKVKSGLRKRDIDRFRKILLEKRVELFGDYESLQHDALDPGAGGLSHMPLHMADVGSDNYEHEFTLGLMESERRLLNEIDDALMRIQNGTYGVCLMKGVPIGKPRLDAKPWAKYCIEAVTELERQGKL